MAVTVNSTFTTQNLTKLLTVSLNSDINDVTELVGTMLAYLLIAIVFTMVEYMYFYKSFSNLFGKSYTMYDDRDIKTSTSDQIVHLFISLALKWSLFVCAWTLYTSSVLGPVFNSYTFMTTGVALIQQETFAYVYTGLGCSLATFYNIMGMWYAYYYRDETRRSGNVSGGVVFLKIFMPTMIIAAMVIFPPAWAMAYSPITVSGNGHILGFNLAAGCILVFMLLYRMISFLVIWNRGGDLVKHMPVYDDVRDLIYNFDATLTDDEVSKDGHGKLYGHMGGIYLPTSWIIAHVFLFLSSTYTIYVDGTKPVVLTFVGCIVAVIFMLKSQDYRSYFGYHAMLTTYYLLWTFLMGYIMSPFSTGYSNNVVTFTSGNVTYYNVTLNKDVIQANFFLTGPSLSSMSEIRPTTDIAFITSFVVSCICFAVGGMFIQLYVNPAAQVHEKGPLNPATKKQ